MGKRVELAGGSRGRWAVGPEQIPAAGWKDILWRTYREFKDDRVTLIAAAVTYYLLLSLFPTITAFVSIYGLFADPSTVAKHLRVLADVVPAGGMAILDEQLTKLTDTGGTTLGVALLLSLAAAFWSASSGVKTLFEAMNVAYDEREQRSFLLYNGIALLFTVAGVVGAILVVAAVVLVPGGLSLIGLGEGFEWLLRIASYFILSIALLSGLAALYRFGPSREQAKWRWVSPGAILAAAVILIVSLLFSWYAASFGHYDATYGSLGALVGLLTWIWISVAAVIIGAEVNSEAERQTERDSTTGAEAPLGRRGAVVADTVGDERDAAGRADSDRTADWIDGFTAAKSIYARERRPVLKPETVALPILILIFALSYNKRR